jgi:hypothetical protein
MLIYPSPRGRERHSHQGPHPLAHSLPSPFPSSSSQAWIYLHVQFSTVNIFWPCAVGQINDLASILGLHVSLLDESKIQRYFGILRCLYTALGAILLITLST